MNSLFSYDSKLMQTLGFLADLMITNLVYILCCIPIVTIGAATSGLHYSMRTLSNNMDDRSAIKQFFIGFRNGFLKSTFANLLFMILEAMLGYTTMVCYIARATGVFMSWGIPFAALCACLVLHSCVLIFHSQFDCTFGQLLRNGFILMLMYPIRSVLMAAFLWGPWFIALWSLPTFLTITPIFLVLWWSVGCMLSALMTRKPFRALIDHHTGEDVIQEEERARAAAEEEEIEALAKKNLAKKSKEEKEA